MPKLKKINSISCLMPGRVTGKSYIPQEVAAYFPQSEVIEYSGASPTSFFHEKGVRVIETADEYLMLDDFLAPLEQRQSELKSKLGDVSGDEKSKILSELHEIQSKISKLSGDAKILVDLEGKILIFLDQPNTQLLGKLRYHSCLTTRRQSKYLLPTKLVMEEIEQNMFSFKVLARSFSVQFIPK